jgi:hypothetical protein
MTEHRTKEPIVRSRAARDSTISRFGLRARVILAISTVGRKGAKGIKAVKISDEELARLRELPQFYLSQCIAIAGTEPGRRAVVYHKDGTQTWYDDDDSKAIEFREGDEIELIPAAAWSVSLGRTEGDDDE